MPKLVRLIASSRIPGKWQLFEFAPVGGRRKRAKVCFADANGQVGHLLWEQDGGLSAWQRLRWQQAAERYKRQKQL